MSGTTRSGEGDRLASALRGVRALVLDADGVLLLAGSALPGAVEALDRLEAAGVPYRVVTNFSGAHRTSLAAAVSRTFGRPVRPERLITAASAAAAYTLARHPGAPLFVLASDDARREWAGQRLLDLEAAAAPEASVAAVVIGDGGDELSYRNLDIAYGLARRGAELVAMHRNPWWITPKGPTLDSGALVAGLEFALGRTATVAGKPSPVVFRQAVRELAVEVATSGARRLRLAEIAMVGDDLAADVGGAKRVGLRGILVLSGKTDRAGLERASGSGRRRAQPDGVADGILDVVIALVEARPAAC
ncbi:MAG: HAD-IIA family hydrolase [Chloroflexi bacterium]|nr:HAD-IIA family hydrolase [Chloroflexota bacterium]